MAKQITQKQFNQVVEKIVDLGWDYDRMSSSGKQVYDDILTILGGTKWLMNPAATVAVTAHAHQIICAMATQET